MGGLRGGGLAIYLDRGGGYVGLYARYICRDFTHTSACEIGGTRFPH